jgi:hypothetical protein
MHNTNPSQHILLHPSNDYQFLLKDHLDLLFKCFMLLGWIWIYILDIEIEKSKIKKLNNSFIRPIESNVMISYYVLDLE